MAFTKIDATAMKSTVMAMYKSKREQDAALTNAMANAIYHALAELKAGRPGTSVHANFILYQAYVYDKTEATKLRAWLVEYGPFVEDKEKELTMYGEKYIVPLPVKFSEAKAKAKYNADPQFYAEQACAIDFRTWKRAKAEKKPEKSKEEKQEAIKKRLATLKKDAEACGMEIKDTPTVRGEMTFNELLSAVKAFTMRKNITQEEKQVAEFMLETAMNFYAKKADK